MKIPCCILGVNQRVDFGEGRVISSIAVELEDGIILEAELKPEQSDYLIQYYAAKAEGLETPPTQEPALPPQPQEPSPEPPQEPAHIVPMVAQAAQTPSLRPRLVAQDSMGNPIIRGAPNPPAPLIENDVDEDGVAQVGVDE